MDFEVDGGTLPIGFHQAARIAQLPTEHEGCDAAWHLRPTCGAPYAAYVLDAVAWKVEEHHVADLQIESRRVE